MSKFKRNLDWALKLLKKGELTERKLRKLARESGDPERFEKKVRKTAEYTGKKIKNKTPEIIDRELRARKRLERKGIEI